MRFHLFLCFLLATAFAPTGTWAQGALVPATSPNPFIAAIESVFSPAKAKVDPNTVVPATTTGSTETTTAPVLPNLAPTPIYGGQSRATSAPVLYITPAQQSSMIEMEKRKLNSLQGSTVQIGQNRNMILAQLQMVLQGQNREQRDTLMQAQAMTEQGRAQTELQIQQTQKRLAILQAGPLSLADLTKLYQNN